MLPIDWIFAPCEGKKTVGFAEFVVALSHAPHESLFSTDLIETLVDHFWDRYYKAVILKCFLPFIAYFVCTLWYISNYGVSGVHDPSKFGAELVVRFTIVLLIIYFVYFEVRCMLRDKSIYLLDIYNYIDIGTFSLNLYIIYKSSVGLSGDEE